MKSKHDNAEESPRMTHGNVLDDLGFSRSEALEVKVKADVYRELLRYIHERAFAQQELASLLGIHQPDVSNLMGGRVSKFSVSKLIKFAGKLNLGAEVKLTRPKPARTAVAASPGRPQRRTASPA